MGSTRYLGGSALAVFVAVAGAGPPAVASTLVVGGARRRLSNAAAFSTPNKARSLLWFPSRAHQWSIRKEPSLSPLSLSFSSSSSLRRWSSQPEGGFNDEYGYPLEGKRALVTGASGGIGAAIAKRLASHGAHVLVHYHERYEGAVETCRAIQEAGAGRCEGIIQCDFRHAAAIDAMWMEIDKHVWPNPEEGIDVLINNAGVVTKLALQDDDDALSSWHETMAINLHAPLQLSRHAFRRMTRHDDRNDNNKSNRGGVIVNVSSIHGTRSAEYMTAYAVSKAALDSLTRGMALEYAPWGVRVNAVAPGVVPVERTAAAFADPQVVQLWQPTLILQRFGTPQDMADAAVFLCVNSFCTGTVLTIDGGAMARGTLPFRPRPPKSTSGPETTPPSRHNAVANVVFEKPC